MLHIDGLAKLLHVISEGSIVIRLAMHIHLCTLNICAICKLASSPMHAAFVDVAHWRDVFRICLKGQAHHDEHLESMAVAKFFASLSFRTYWERLIWRRRFWKLLGSPYNSISSGYYLDDGSVLLQSFRRLANLWKFHQLVESIFRAMLDSKNWVCLHTHSCTQTITSHRKPMISYCKPMISHAKPMICDWKLIIFFWQFMISHRKPMNR